MSKFKELINEVGVPVKSIPNGHYPIPGNEAETIVNAVNKIIDKNDKIKIKMIKNLLGNSDMYDDLTIKQWKELKRITQA